MQRDASFLRAWSAAPIEGAKGLDDDDEDAVVSRRRRRFRTLWISDLHLGTPGCQAHALLDFLKHTECETLFVVGDIIDGWQLRHQWYWPQAHNDVIQKLLRKARKGTRVIFIPGNHNEFARRYVNHNFAGIDVADDWIHETADGRKLWITHGDLFDGVIQCAEWLAHVGDSLCEFTLRLNRHLNSLRARAGLPYSSLSYSAADSFVFPSRSETFGLVMLEAMACGLPVAAYPVTGPIDVVGGSMGGVLDVDLRRDALASPALPRERARERALEFDWAPVCGQFIDLLVPARSGVSLDTSTVTKRSQKIHKLVS